jgi:hypothetical protein
LHRALDYLAKSTFLVISFTFFRNKHQQINVDSSRIFFIEKLTLHNVIFRSFQNYLNNSQSIHVAQTIRERSTFLSSFEVIHNQSFENERRKKKSTITSSYARNVFLQARNMFKKLISFFVVSRVIMTSSSRVWRLLFASYDSQNSTIRILRFFLFRIHFCT